MSANTINKQLVDDETPEYRVDTSPLQSRSQCTIKQHHWAAAASKQPKQLKTEKCVLAQQQQGNLGAEVYYPLGKLGN